MNSDEVFTKLIQKVIDKGFTPFAGLEVGFKWRYENGNFWISAPIWDFKQEKMVEQLHARNIEGIIFDHTFCRCLWGEEIMDIGIASWRYNLQLLALSDDRAGFLSQFVEEKLSTGNIVVDSKIDEVV